MNQTDRERLARLYSALSKLPWPNRSKTLGPAELSEFFVNMETLVPLFQSSIMSISRCDVEDPDEELDYLEAEMAKILGVES